MTVVEAMSVGLPLIVTESGGLGELVDEDGAIRVPERDAGALAQAILTVLASPKRALEMGDHNRARAVREFSWSAVGDELETTYYSLLERACGRNNPAANRTEQAYHVP